MAASYVFLLLLVACSAAPAVDQPIRIDLPVVDPPEVNTRLQLDETALGEDRSDRSLVRGLLSQKLHAAQGLIAAGSKLAPHDKIGEPHGYGLFSPPVTTLEGAILETEGLGSRKLSIKENIQHMVAGFLQPKPIVDTIREEEKYGNTGDKFYAAGRAVVGGAEGVSNLVNSVLEVPGAIFKKITQAASEKLNNLGGRLIGL